MVHGTSVPSTCSVARSSAASLGIALTQALGVDTDRPAPAPAWRGRHTSWPSARPVRMTPDGTPRAQVGEDGRMESTQYVEIARAESERGELVLRERRGDGA